LHDTLAHIRCLAVYAGIWLKGLVTEASADVRQVIAH